MSLLYCFKRSITACCNSRWGLAQKGWWCWTMAS